MRTFRMGRRLVAALLLVGLSTSAIMPGVAHAADGFNLTVSPLPINVVTSPGKAVSTPVRVQNSGTEAVRIKVSLMKFAADGTTGSPKLLDATPQDEYIKWAKFSLTSFVAQPGVFNTITMTISPPKSAAFGYYYAVVFSQDNGTQPVEPSQNKINGAVASLVMLNVETAGEKRQLDVTGFSAGQKVYQYLPATFNITVKNSGNIHAVPTGTVFIKRAGSDEILATLRVNSQQGNVLPKSSRQFTAEWNDGFPRYDFKRQNDQIVSGKDGKPIRELNWDLSNAGKFRLGKYNASMTLIYSNGQRDIPINGEVSFWVIPWVPFIIALAILALVGVGLFVLIRTVIRKTRCSRKTHEKTTS